MITATKLRALALALPEAAEQDHHGFPSFRVRGKIFATLPTATQLNVMLDPEDAAAAAVLAPSVVEELWWGKKLSGVRVDLGKAKVALVAKLLADAWQRKAPRALLNRPRPR